MFVYRQLNLVKVCMSPLVHSSAPLNLSASGFRVLGIDRLGVRDGFKIVAYFTCSSIITLAVLRKKGEYI